MAALKFMLTWQKATTVRRIHFFFVDQAVAVAERDVCSFSTMLDVGGGFAVEEGRAGTGLDILDVLEVNVGESRLGIGRGMLIIVGWFL